MWIYLVLPSSRCWRVWDICCMFFSLFNFLPIFIECIVLPFFDWTFCVMMWNGGEFDDED